MMGSQISVPKDLTAPPLSYRVGHTKKARGLDLKGPRRPSPPHPTRETEGQRGKGPKSPTPRVVDLHPALTVTLRRKTSAGQPREREGLTASDLDQITAEHRRAAGRRRDVPPRVRNHKNPVTEHLTRFGCGHLAGSTISEVGGISVVLPASVRETVPEGQGLNGVERAIVPWTLTKAEATRPLRSLSTMPDLYVRMNPDKPRPMRLAILVDLALIAELLNVPKDTVNKWRHRRLLPEPDFPLAVGPVWEWETIRAWAEETGRLDG